MLNGTIYQERTEKRYVVIAFGVIEGWQHQGEYENMEDANQACTASFYRGWVDTAIIERSVTYKIVRKPKYETD